MIKYIKDILMYMVTKEFSNIYSENDKQKMTELAEKTNKDSLLDIIYALSKLENDLKWSTQKNVVFQVEILKLCSIENLSIEDRVEKLENSMKNGNVYMHFETGKEKNNIQNVSTNGAKNVDRAYIKPTQNGNKVSQPGAMTPPKGNMSSSGANFWGNVIENLKQARMPMLYSNLMNAKAVVLDDMTVGIEFPNGLNSFGRGVIEKPENMQKLKELVSIECKKDMRIKLIDEKKEQNDQETNGTLDLGININMIDE